jgi:cell division protein FtsZ
VSQAADEIHGVSHPDANIIFGTVIDDEMAATVRVTVIAAGFDRWDSDRARKPSRSLFRNTEEKEDGLLAEVFGEEFDDEDGLEVPDFLK